MDAQRLDVSSLFHVGRGAAEPEPPEHALHGALLEPPLGPIRLEDLGRAVRLWVFDGGWMVVPKSLTSVVGRWRNWVKVDFNGEMIVLEFDSDELAGVAADIFGALAIAG